MKDLLSHASAFRFGEVVGSEFVGTEVRLREQRDGTVKWAVYLYGGTSGPCYDKIDKCFDFEPLPSSRTASFIKRTRFSLKTAVKIAEEQAAKMVADRKSLYEARDRIEAGQKARKS
jgi:hypothetical protein